MFIQAGHAYVLPHIMRRTSHYTERFDQAYTGNNLTSCIFMQHITTKIHGTRFIRPIFIAGGQGPFFSLQQGPSQSFLQYIHPLAYEDNCPRHAHPPKNQTLPNKTKQQHPLPAWFALQVPVVIIRSASTNHYPVNPKHYVRKQDN